jgi:hypothetical protein
MFWKNKSETFPRYYYVKVGREGGEGKAEDVTGLVGIT